MATPKPKGQLAIYPRCEAHMTRAGLTVAEASRKSGVATASITRIRNQVPVLVTTVVKLINAMNDHHYKRENQALTPDVEIQRV